MKHVMVDIETMGNTSNAAILSIGAVYFEIDGIGDTFYKKVSLESSVDAGLQMDPETVLWWLQQNEAARANFQTPGGLLPVVLKQFTEFLKPDVFIWGNGSDFDNVILENAYEKVNQKCPWNYYQNRCFRTLKSLHPNIQIPENKIKHDALQDALWQANYAMRVINSDMQ